MRQVFTFIGIPKGQPRPRFRQITTKAGHSFAHAYEPKEATQYKDNLRAQIVSQAPRLIERDVPVRLVVECYLPRPQAHFNSKGLLKPNAPKWCTKKPDSDNILKAIKDAMTGIVWHDDNQVVSPRGPDKFYCAPGEQPRVIICVEEIEVEDRVVCSFVSKSETKRAEAGRLL